MAEKTQPKVKVGDKIPDFTVYDQQGNEITNRSLLGNKTILFFYPKDNTPTCTKVACNIRDNYEVFTQNGYKVYGVSKDSVKSHVGFIAKNHFPFSLLSDPNLSALKAFGFYGPKKFMGREVIGTYRTTVVFDEKGIITHIIDKVASADHTAQLRNLIGI